MTEEKKNKDFVQVYRSYIDELTKLALEQPKSYKLLMLLIKHMDGTNSLIVSNVVLQELLGLSRATVCRSVKYLKENGWIDVLKSGTTNVYVVNPNVAWTSYANQKEYCKFNSSVLLSATENAEFLKNRDATNHYKTIDTEFIKAIQEKQTAYEEECKNFKENYN